MNFEKLENIYLALHAIAWIKWQGVEDGRELEYGLDRVTEEDFQALVGIR